MYAFFPLSTFARLELYTSKNHVLVNHVGSDSFQSLILKVSLQGPYSTTTYLKEKMSVI